MVGQFIIPWIPKALVLLVVCLAVVWIPFRLSRFGLSVYAIGSDSLAAFRTGVAVNRVKIGAYAMAGLFAAMGGLVLTMSTGIGAPIPGPLSPGQRCGGRAGWRGAGRRPRRPARTDHCRLHPAPRAHPNLTFLSVDPNVTTIVEGTIMVVVVMIGGLLAVRRRRA